MPLLDHLLARRFRAGFERDLVPESSRSGFEGFLEEALAFYRLAPDIRHACVKNHLRRYFGPGASLVRIGMRYAPDATLQLMRRSLPTMLSWMVGPFRSDTPDPTIAQCKVLERCGSDVCVELCKRPTEDFFEDELDIDLELQPDFVSASCLVRMRHEPRGERLTQRRAGKVRRSPQRRRA